MTTILGGGGGVGGGGGRLYTIVKVILLILFISTVNPILVRCPRPIQRCTTQMSDILWGGLCDSTEPNSRPSFEIVR